MFVALCPELDVESQGRTVALARKNLEEEVSLFLETASKKEIAGRLHAETYISPMEMTVDA